MRFNGPLGSVKSSDVEILGFSHLSFKDWTSLSIASPPPFPLPYLNPYPLPNHILFRPSAMSCFSFRLQSISLTMS
jgi:hypothetical protein